MEQSRSKHMKEFCDKIIQRQNDEFKKLLDSSQNPEELRLRFENNKFSHKYIFISNEDEQKYITSVNENDLCKFHDYIRDIDTTYNKELIAHLIEDDNYFESIIKLLSNDLIGTITVGKKMYGDVKGLCYMPKSIFAKIVKSMVDNGTIKSSDKTDAIEYLTSPEIFDDNNAYFCQNVEGKDINFKEADLFNFFKNSNFWDLETFKHEIKVLGQSYNLSEEEISYALIMYVNKNKVLEKYSFNPYIEMMYNKLENFQIYEFSHINKNLITEDPFLADTVVNQELIDYVFHGMPDDLNLLEKSIYVYITLCKTLAYAPDFYAHDQKGQTARVHEDISRLAKITPENNEIVCYEFSQIYGYFLNLMGIHYASSAFFNYGGGHANLTYRVGKHIIRADAVNYIVNGDLLNAKINGNLDGLTILSKNQDVKNEFYNSFNKVYDILKKKDNANELTLDDLLTSYRRQTEYLDISINDKLDILQRKIKHMKLDTLAQIGIILQTAKKIFAKEIDSNQISTTILAKKVGESLSDLMPRIIIAEHDLIYNTYTYHEYNNETNSFETISQEEAQKMYDKEEYRFIGKEHPLKGLDTAPKPIKFNL